MKTEHKHFTPADAIDGVKGSKPRFKSAREALPELNRVYLENRNAKLKAQAFMAETQAKERAGELISKALVTRQAQYILICLRQEILNFPTRYARQMVGLPNEHEAKQLLTRAAHEFLNELASFPSRITNPDWLKAVEGENEQPKARAASGAEISAEQKKAKIRRKQKTETMRRLRAKG